MNKGFQQTLFYPDSIQDWARIEHFTAVMTQVEEASNSNAELAKLPHNSSVRQQLVNEAESLYIESRRLDSFLGIQRTCRNCLYKTTLGVKGE